MANSWNNLRAPLVDTPEKATEHDARVARVAAEHDAHARTMAELRKARRLTQAQLAEELGMQQGEVSRIERREDLYLSTLARFVSALGGHLELRVTFDDEQTPTVLQLGDLTRREPDADDTQRAA